MSLELLLDYLEAVLDYELEISLWNSTTRAYGANVQSNLNSMSKRSAPFLP